MVGRSDSYLTIRWLFKMQREQVSLIRKAYSMLILTGFKLTQYQVVTLSASSTSYPDPRKEVINRSFKKMFTVMICPPNQNASTPNLQNLLNKISIQKSNFSLNALSREKCDSFWILAFRYGFSRTEERWIDIIWISHQRSTLIRFIFYENFKPILSTLRWPATQTKNIFIIHTPNYIMLSQKISRWNLRFTEIFREL